MTTPPLPPAAGDTGCTECRLALGVYVVGAIDPAERATVDRHVARCEGCREELAALAGIPGLLGRLDEADVLALSEPVRPDGALLDRVLAAAAARRRALRRRLVAAAAAAAVLLAGAGVGTVAALHRNESPTAPAPAVRMSSAAGPVRAEVALFPKAWGTAVDLRLSGVSYGERCSMVAVAADGTTDTAASWRSTETGKATVTGATAMFVPQIRAVRIVAGNGRPLVTVSR